MVITIYSLKLFALLHYTKLVKSLNVSCVLSFLESIYIKCDTNRYFFPDSYPRNRYIEDKKQIRVVTSLH